MTKVTLSERALLYYARYCPIWRGKLRVVDWFWRRAAGQEGVHRISVLKYGGFVMPCDISEMLQRQFYFFGTYLTEVNILNAWQEASRGARVIFDVGANAGIYSLAGLAIAPLATVHAFEPTPEIADRLRKTVTMNGLKSLMVHETAVSDVVGEAALVRFRGELGSNEGMNFISADFVGADTERIATISIDEFCREHAIDYIDLLKMDIQGHESAALRGAAGMIAGRKIGTIFLELNWASGPNCKCSATDSINILEAAGYEFAEAGPELVWRSSGDWLRKSSDVIARVAGTRPS